MTATVAEPKPIDANDRARKVALNEIENQLAIFAKRASLADALLLRELLRDHDANALEGSTVLPECFRSLLGISEG